MSAQDTDREPRISSDESSSRDWLEGTLIEAVAALSGREPVAVAIQFGIWLEAAVRRWWAFWMRPWESMGLTTADDVIVMAERQSALVSRVHELEDTAGTASAERGMSPGNARRRPVVNFRSSGGGDALLLLNGWTASGLVWPGRWIRDLEARFRVIRVDNRGSGWSRTAPAPYDIGDLADDAAAVLRALHVEKATVLGLSMGGAIAQELALRHPRLVSALVLVGTRPPTPGHIPGDPAELAAALRPKSPSESLPEFYRKMWARQMAPGFAAANSAVMDEVVDQVLKRVTPRKMAMTQARAMSSWSGPGRLRSISAPTIVVHGRLDRMMPVGNGIRLAQLIPDARYVELREVGHLVPFEAPDALLAALTDVSTRPLTGGTSVGEGRN
jgi:pimeloyl-ACP methyl ester carboxylesterase